MPARNKLALQIQQGASNPRPIAKTLLDAIDECRAEGKNERDDDAVFLLVHQLAWVLTGHDIALACGAFDRYSTATTNLNAAMTEFANLTKD